jgi:hypothetical protein
MTKMLNWIAILCLDLKTFAFLLMALHCSGCGRAENMIRTIAMAVLSATAISTFPLVRLWTLSSSTGRTATTEWVWGTGVWGRVWAMRGVRFTTDSVFDEHHRDEYDQESQNDSSSSHFFLFSIEWSSGWVRLDVLFRDRYSQFLVYLYEA